MFSEQTNGLFHFHFIHFSSLKGDSLSSFHFFHLCMLINSYVPLASSYFNEKWPKTILLYLAYTANCHQKQVKRQHFPRSLVFKSLIQQKFKKSPIALHSFQVYVYFTRIFSIGKQMTVIANKIRILKPRSDWQITGLISKTMIAQLIL